MTREEGTAPASSEGSRGRPAIPPCPPGRPGRHRKWSRNGIEPLTDSKANFGPNIGPNQNLLALPAGRDGTGNGLRIGSAVHWQFGIQIFPVLGRFSAKLGPQTPLERRGSSCSAGCTKNQPRRPILRLFLGNSEFGIHPPPMNR